MTRRLLTGGEPSAWRSRTSSPSTPPLDTSLPGIHLHTLTADGLVAYRRVGGANGGQLVPNLAVAIPVPTDGGRTYTFRVRRGVRYSSGAVVSPDDFRRGLERLFRLGSAPGFYDAIVGTEGCRRRPATCDLSKGVVADAAAGTVTIRLTRPDPNLLFNLALPLASAVAPGVAMDAPAEGGLPATGPYVIASHRPEHEVRLVRNPMFREGSRAARPDGYPDEILLTAVDGVDAVEAVDKNRLDIAPLLGGLAPARLEQVDLGHPGRLQVAPFNFTYLVALDTTRPPFDNLDARRAVAFALDRDELVRRIGGPRFAQPACQVLPPNFPGYEPYCPHTQDPRPDGQWTRPDASGARRLVAASGTSGSRVTVWTAPNHAREAQYVAAVMRDIGYRARAREVSLEAFGPLAFGPDSNVQATVTGWGPDFPAPLSFFDVLRCGMPNPARFCDPTIDRRMDEALALQATDPTAANRLWAEIDRAVTDRAPWIGYATPRGASLLSPTLGNVQRHPYFGVLLDQLWVR